LLQQRKIESLAQEWENSGRKSAYLLVGFRLKEARKFQKEQALQYPLKKLGSDFIAKSVGKQRQNWLKFGVIPLVGVGVITFFGIRTYIVQSSWKIVQETQGEKYDLRKINALEDLVLWQESLAKISFKKANLSQIQLPNANLYRANFYYANLYDANLNYVDLQLANLYSADLRFANLYSADLYYANLQSANLYYADLRFANLNYADLQSTDLISADLYDANLYSANLNSANLISANLISADLYSANLESANLNGAILVKAENLTETQIKSACFWDKAIYKGRYDEQKDKWITDEKANQAFIAQLKKDKASDPKVKPDCSKWEY
jgi:uncharacterized protein YjbI with pentapeptide repeats